ncbi:MAG: glycosyltransferase [Candidatus Cloacimonetes bacterium]|nr:glycosyltransferase [Candidatus Cloacimonadota bacterium]MBL7087133.1 glycosyltransferase [Candidatus Cloacimonadota bacterium]
MYKTRILIIAQPAFVNGLKFITKELSNMYIKVLPFDDRLWEGKNIIQKMIFIKKFDIIHFFRGRTTLVHFLSYRIFSRTKIINQFIGTDLYRILNKGCFKKSKLRLCSRISLTIATGEILHNELNALKIKNKTLDFINNDIKKTNYNFPIEKRAIAYLPSYKKTFFNRKILYQLALDFPDTEFTWFPYSREKDEKIPPNVNCIDYIPRHKILSRLEENKVFLRISKHDGLPNTLLEALSIGRWVVWSYPFKYVSTFHSYEVLKNKFNNLINRKKPNVEGEKFVLENYNIKVISKEFEKIYKETLI